MGYLLGDENELCAWILDEVEIQESLERGASGGDVKRVQEWLNLHDLRLAIDGDFGPVTESQVMEFQQAHGLEPTGIVDNDTFQELAAPLRRVLAPIPVDTSQATLASVVAAYAQAHLQEHPLEIGGENRGPWVRLYMEGHEGPAWKWCAGFVKFVVWQAAETLQMSPAIPGSFSCDSLAAQGNNAGLFVQESDIADGTTSISDLPVASIFLVRRTDTDWTHTGFVTLFNENSFDTIEGNTNDDGSAEGYEVCARTRGYNNKDFIRL